MFGVVGFTAMSSDGSTVDYLYVDTNGERVTLRANEFNSVFLLMDTANPSGVCFYCTRTVTAVPAFMSYVTRTNITNLELILVDLTQSDLDHLCVALSSRPDGVLESLDLQRNQITDARPLASVVATNKGLELLHVRGNPLEDVARDVLHILAAIHPCRQLRIFASECGGLSRRKAYEIFRAAWPFPNAGVVVRVSLSDGGPRKVTVPQRLISATRAILSKNVPVEIMRLVAGAILGVGCQQQIEFPE